MNNPKKIRELISLGGSLLSSFLASFATFLLFLDSVLLSFADFFMDLSPEAETLCLFAFDAEPAAFSA